MVFVFVVLALVVVFLAVIFFQGGSNKTSGNFAESRGSAKQLMAREREDILALLREGKKIQAIKICRSLTGCGLREAKEMIETLEQEV